MLYPPGLLAFVRFSDLFAVAVQRVEIVGAGEIERTRSVGKGEQVNHFPVMPVIKGHLTVAVTGKNHLHLTETGGGFIFIRYGVCTDKGKEGRVEIFGNLFYAAKIKDIQPVYG